MSVISDTLSTTIPLHENELFQSPPTDLEGFNQISITCNFTSAPNELNLIVEFSIDSINYDHTETFPIINDITFFENLQVKSRYCRITLQNNNVVMNSLRLETIVHTNPNTLNVVVDGTSTITLSNGTNNNRINDILHTADVITANTHTPSIDLKASGSEMYNSITVSGKSPELYNMVLEYSNDNTIFYTDHIEPEVVQKGNNTHYEFSLTRNSINHRYVRIYHLLGSSSLDLIYSITRH